MSEPAPGTGLPDTRILDIVALGEPMVEFNQVRPGEPCYLQGFGGDSSNAAIAAARAGARCGYVSRVGADPFGEALLALWRAEGVDASGVAVDPGAPTGIYFVQHAAGGDGAGGHRFTYRRAGSAASRMTADEPGLALVRRTRILHVSGIGQAISDSASAATAAAIAIAREAGALVSYDPNLRPALWGPDRFRPAAEAAMARADIVLPSLEDVALLTGRDAPDTDAGIDAALDWILGFGPRVVALTLGARGAAIATRERRARIPAAPARAVDATGAGDCFDGNFLAEYLRTGDPFAAAAFAVTAAAIATEGFGAVAPLPRRAEVEARMARAQVGGRG